MTQSDPEYVKNAKIHARIGIIIVNYNGEALLQECLPSIFKACDHSGFEYEVLVVDNASDDGSRDFIRKNYPPIKVILQDYNKYWFAANDGILESKYEYVLLLNNDVKLGKDCIRNLIKNFDRDDNILAVMPKEILCASNKTGIGANGLKFKNGIIMREDVPQSDKTCITFQVGMAMYNKGRLLDTGLFDPLFYPFFYEDVDISYRAWKMGFKIIYEPTAVYYHKSRVTINKFFTDDSQRVYGYKNSLLFIWKNVTDVKIIFLHMMYLFLALLSALAPKRRYILKGFLLAILSFPDLLCSRKKVIKKFILSDRNIFKIFNRETAFWEKI